MAAASGSGLRSETPEEMVSSFFSSQSELSTVPSNIDLQAATDKVTQYRETDNGDDTISILSSFLMFLPAEGKQMLAEFIMHNNVGDQHLKALAVHLLTAILVPMKARVTPAITPSPFSDEDDVADLAASLEEPATRAGQQALKMLCLRRDNFRCLATGFVEYTESQRAPEVMSVKTKLAHILPFSLGRWDTPEQERIISQKWATLTRCFPGMGLGPSEINDPKNLMTLESGIHEAFDNFNVIFEPMEGDVDKYRLVTIGKYPTILQLYLPGPNAQGDRIVEFQNHDSDSTSLPSRDLLQIHAALARILHATGMGNYIDKVMEDRDTLRCLSSDGSTSSQVLLFAF